GGAHACRLTLALTSPTTGDARLEQSRWLQIVRRQRTRHKLIRAVETILVKIFAVALALSHVTTTPDAVKTRFERASDQEQVGGLLRAGCMHMRKALDIEDINLED